jgi:hypothetical protein
MIVENIQYSETVNKEESKIIAIDFDGVIHNNSLGFHDGTIYGEILPGAKDAIIYLSKRHDIVIYTAKAKLDRPLVNGKSGVELVWEWLKKHELDSHVIDVTAEKPRCIVYIDDKAIRFENWKDTMNILLKLYGI